MATLTWIGVTKRFLGHCVQLAGWRRANPRRSVIVNGENSADILNGTSVTVASLSIEGVGAAGGTVIVGAVRKFCRPPSSPASSRGTAAR